MRGWSVFALVIVAALAACGDTSEEEPLNCTLIGCSDGVHLVVRAPRDGWRAGDYTVEISGGGDSRTCTATLPNASQSTDSTPFKCDHGSWFGFFTGSEGCADGLDGGIDGATCGTLELEVPGTPSSMQVRIDRNGEAIFDETRKPKYRELEPNGHGCEPICKRSSVEWTLAE